MKKTLILKSDRDEFEKYFLENMQNKYCTTLPYYKDIASRGYLRYLAVLWMEKLNLPFQFIWYGSWKKELDQYEQVIIFDRVWGKKILSYIHKKAPQARIIFWYWNALLNKKVLPTKYRKFCECWSFDSYDVDRYQMNYNHMFYFPDKCCKQECMYDAFFVGADKGRVPILKKMGEIFQENNLEVKLIVVGKNKEQDSRISFQEENYGYIHYLELLKNSRCIIDIVQEGQEGVTIRIIEALMYEKKIITTNKNLKKYEFYSEDNIFIWGERSCEELIKFVKTPYKKIDEQLKKMYSFEQWLKNFEVKI